MIVEYWQEQTFQEINEAPERNIETKFGRHLAVQKANRGKAKQILQSRRTKAILIEIVLSNNINISLSRF
jgi:hypothetical protein